MEYKIFKNCSVEIFETFNEDDFYNFNLKIYRGFRELKLIETDKYMNMLDRYTPEQVEQLKTYRQELRDFINLNQDSFKFDKDKHNLKEGYTPEALLKVPYPIKPEFIN